VTLKTSVVVVVVVVVVVGIAVTACGPKSRTPTWGPSDDHVTPADAGVHHVPPLTLDEARKHLAAARAADDAFGVVVYGNRVLAAGGTVDLDFTPSIDRLDPDLLAAAWAELDTERAPAPRVALRLALVALHSGDDDAALKWADLARGDAEIEKRAAALRDEVAARRAVDPTVVAVLLPLSGPHEAIGREIESAVQLAAATHAGARVVFLDTAGEQAGAIAAVESAVYKHRAVAILGPVGQRSSRAAVGRAVELGIPIALLAPGAGGGAPDAGVFRLWPSGSWVAAAAAREAVRRGYDRLGVLAPRDEYGWAQLEAFRAAAVEQGARVVAVGQYDPTATDLEPDLKEFLLLDPAKNARLRKHLRKYKKDGWKTFSPDIEFDLLFIPDEYQRAALVVAYLPFFNVELRTTAFIDTVSLERKHGGRIPSLVQLMGTPGWHHLGLIARGGRVVEGALVVDVCSGGDSEEFASEGAAEFFERFQRANHRAPSSAASQAYDAARLVLVARAAAAERAASTAAAGDRTAFTAALLGARIDDGACGEASVGADGEIQRRVVVLRVDGGEFMVDGD
jgi:ABC-type branched-subunit amino acid transport system substrate-binding protein